MRTQLAASNPFGYDRYGYAWQKICENGSPGRHLDYGTYDGHVPHELIRTGVVSHAVAADVVDVESNYRIRHGLGPESGRLDFARIENYCLDYASSSFDSITLLDVLEHVANQGALLSELHRLLKPEGHLIVTVPARHLFSFLDSGNWKFLFPALHRWYYERRHSRHEYHVRYRDPSDGLIGDIEIEKSWHEHFTKSHLIRTLNATGFSVFDMDGAGFFSRPLSLIAYALPDPAPKALNKVSEWDARAFHSAHLFTASHKIRPLRQPNGA